VEQLKIVVTDYIEPDLNWEAEELAKHDNVRFEQYQLKFAPQEELLSAIRVADVVVVNMAPMTAEVIGALERCRLIIRHGIGYDNVDLKAATAKGIRVANIPDYCPEEVAEHAIAHIFSCYRQVVRSRKVLEESSRKGTWDFSGVPRMFRMSGKTLGIVGCGRVGSRVLKKMEGMEMSSLVCDPYLSEERKRELKIECVDLETVLKGADVVTLHTPLGEETRHLIGAPQLRLMKETAYLINTARGPIVDVDALAQALREGWIAGAGIDVYEKEPPDPTYPLFGLENAVLTPHLAWSSEEAGWDIRVKILEDIRRFMDGKPPRFVVNPEVEEVLGGQE